MTDLQKLSDTMREWSTTAGDHHWQAHLAIQELIQTKAHLSACIGIPASVGICEPIEGYAERPVDLKPAMRDMAKIINELKVQLESLRQAVIQYDDCDSSSQTKKAIRHMVSLAKSTPKQCLAEFEAQVVEQVFKHFKNKFNGNEKLTVRDICWMLDGYSNHLRHQAKAGDL